MVIQAIGRKLTSLGVMTSRPLAFAVVAAYGGLWFAFDRASLDWHGVATLATWLMTLLIQRAEHRDTQAVQAKLDELLHAGRHTQNHLTRLDDKEPEEIERFRQGARRHD
jgi:low affinity Fe/Cu permease